MRTAILVTILAAMIVAAWLVIDSMAPRQALQEPPAGLAPIQRAYDAKRTVEQGNAKQQEILDRAAKE